jgi:hypothetical protein
MDLDKYTEKVNFFTVLFWAGIISSPLFRGKSEQILTPCSLVKANRTLICFMFACLAHSSTLKMDTIFTSETTQRATPQETELFISIAVRTQNPIQWQG